MAQQKKLYRSSTNKVFLGVLGGFGEYFNIDPVLLRVGFILITLFAHVFPGIIVYFLAAAVMPVKK
jgi:phage shock protein C